MTVQPRAVDWT